MNLEELEKEIRMHRRGRRRELLILWAVAAVFLGGLAGVVLLLL